MRNLNLTDTIAAVATAVGEGGIGIVRVSGKGALKIADRVFLAKDGKLPSSFKTYTTHYGWIVDSRQPDAGHRTSIVDEVILTVMRAPRSYTKEDVVEINCHGGVVALRGVLELILDNGCRLAEPGEFTRRAFLNGRIDLAQAEAVLDIIRAKTDSALKIGAEQLRGIFSSEINKLRRRLLEILSVLEANIDFPEEEIGALELKKISEKLTNLDTDLKEFLKNSRQGRIFREGIHAVICGKPNVGKSSLLNALLKRERSIVTPVAGTTRDTIEEIIDIKGIPVRIVDTAGIIEPRDLVEKEAVGRSKKHMAAADLIILMFDGGRPLSREDLSLMRSLKSRNTIAVINKSDLKQIVNKEKILKAFPVAIEISARRLKNIHLLEEAIAGIVLGGKIVQSESVMSANLRHIGKLKEAQKLVAQSLHSLDNSLTLELIAQDARDALTSLDELLGKKFSEDLLDKIFSDFCIGK